MMREIFSIPITMDRRDASLTVAEPLGMLEASRKMTRYLSYPLACCVSFGDLMANGRYKPATIPGRR